MLPALKKAANQLAKASLPEAKEIRDKAEAVRAYLRRAGECLAVQNQCCTVKLRAERRIGELLAGMVRRGRPKRLHDATLSDLGITKTQSHRFQLIARLPAKVFEHHIEQARELTTAGVLKLAKRYVRSQRRHTGPEAGGNVLTGDMVDLNLAANSVDLILTDPPYSDTDAYARLAELAADTLKRGGLCLAYAGQSYLPKILGAMAEHLDYYWTFAVGFAGGQNCLIYPRNIQVRWKPIVAFCKSPAAKHDWLNDLLAGGAQEKTLHVWQQRESEAEYLIERLTGRGALVVDPFCGSGTVLAAAKALGRNWIGCDSDAGAARTARKRLAA